jgi:hypothetical protein
MPRTFLHKIKQGVAVNPSILLLTLEIIYCNKMPLYEFILVISSISSIIILNVYNGNKSIKSEIFFKEV